MKIDFRKELKDIFGRIMTWETVDATDERGNPIKNERGDQVKRSVVATLQQPSISALIGMTNKEELETRTAKTRRWALATRIQSAADGVVDLEAEDVAFLKELIAASFGTVVVGPAFALLDPKTEEDEQ